MKAVVDVNSLTTKLVKDGVVSNPKTVLKAVKKARVQVYKFERSFGTKYTKGQGCFEILILESSIPSILKAIKEIQNKGEDIAEMKDLYRAKREREVTVTKNGVVQFKGSRKEVANYLNKVEGLKSTGQRIKDGKVIRGYTISVNKAYHTEKHYRYRILGASC